MKNALLTLLVVLALHPSITGRAEKPKKSADYFPLKAGDSWTYRTIGDEGGYRIKVVSEEPPVDGSKRYLVEMDASVKVLSVFSKAGGWVLMHSQRYPEHEGLEAKYEPPRQYLPDPLVAGTKWNWKGRDYTQVEQRESHVVSGPEEVTVAAGKFKAMKIVSQITTGMSSMTKTYWYADGVGLVKSTTEGGQVKYGSELVDYSFKKI
ncbi:MAG TPA: hypothetical protein VJS88_01285, partial [Chthoniobacterales bacterium]|nr:hypothetical protein [Chthoniobacterales bacterium]